MKGYIQTCLLAFAALPGAFGQSLGDLPQCARPCAANLPAECNAVDIHCICASSTWISNMSCCVTTACSPDDQTKTIQVATNLCKLASVTLPTSASCPANSATTASGSSAASSASSAAGTATTASATSASATSASATGSATAKASSVSSSSSAAATGSSSKSATSATGSSSSASRSATSTGAAGHFMAQGIGAAGAAAVAIALL